jgi:hypothetical protein
MTTLRFKGKSRKAGDVFAEIENNVVLFYVIAYDESCDELSFERIDGGILRLLAFDKFEAALNEVSPLRRATNNG